MSAPLIEKLRNEQKIRQAALKNLKRDGQIYADLERQRVEAANQDNPNPMLRPAPTYHDISALLNEMSSKDRDHAYENSQCLALLIPVCKGSEAAARALMKMMTQDERLAFVEFHTPFLEAVRTSFAGKTIQNSTFVAFLRKFMEDNLKTDLVANDVSTVVTAAASSSSSAPNVTDASMTGASSPPSSTNTSEFTTPVKTTPLKATTKADKMKIIMDHVDTDTEMKQMAMKHFLDRYKKNFNKSNIDKAGAGYVSDLYDHLFGNQELAGSGLRQRRTIRGRGNNDPYTPNKKYYCNMDKLRQGVLEVKYTSTNQAKIKAIAISKDCAEVIADIFGGHFKPKLYNLLPEKEQQHVQFLVYACGLDSDVKIENSLVDRLYEKYEVLLGEMQAGNDANRIRTDLRKVVTDLMKYRRLPHSEGLTLLSQLA